MGVRFSGSGRRCSSVTPHDFTCVCSQSYVRPRDAHARVLVGKPRRAARAREAQGCDARSCPASSSLVFVSVATTRPSSPSARLGGGTATDSVCSRALAPMATWSLNESACPAQAGAPPTLIRSPRRRAAGIDVDNSTIHVSERDYDINPRFSAFIGFARVAVLDRNHRFFAPRCRGLRRGHALRARRLNW